MFSFSNICFYGGGAWGQALAIALASLGHKSTLIVSDQIRADEINSHTSKKFPHIQLSHLINASVNASATIKKSNLVFITTESKRVIDVVKQIFLLKDENISMLLPHKVLQQWMGRHLMKSLKMNFQH